MSLYPKSLSLSFIKSSKFQSPNKVARGVAAIALCWLQGFIPRAQDLMLHYPQPTFVCSGQHLLPPECFQNSGLTSPRSTGDSQCFPTVSHSPGCCTLVCTNYEMLIPLLWSKIVECWKEHNKSWWVVSLRWGGNNICSGFANWTWLRSVRWSEENRTSWGGWNYPSWWRGRQEIDGINRVSAPSNQKSALKHWEGKHSKQETTSPSVEVAQEEVGQLERCICIWSGDRWKQSKGALLPCEKPPDFFFTPAWVAATTPQVQQAPPGNVTCPVWGTAAHLFSLFRSIWSPYFAAFSLMQWACGE